jgi:hypothetical protein
VRKRDKWERQRERGERKKEEKMGRKRKRWERKRVKKEEVKKCQSPSMSLPSVFSTCHGRQASLLLFLVEVTVNCCRA